MQAKICTFLYQNSSEMRFKLQKIHRILKISLLGPRSLDIDVKSWPATKCLELRSEHRNTFWIVSNFLWSDKCYQTLNPHSKALGKATENSHKFNVNWSQWSKMKRTKLNPKFRGFITSRILFKMHILGQLKIIRIPGIKVIFVKPYLFIFSNSDPQNWDRTAKGTPSFTYLLCYW